MNPSPASAPAPQTAPPLSVHVIEPNGPTGSAVPASQRGTAESQTTRDGQHFALKLPLSSAGKQPPKERCATEQRIVREVVSLMTVQHPGVVRIHSFDRLLRCSQRAKA